MASKIISPIRLYTSSKSLVFSSLFYRAKKINRVRYSSQNFNFDFKSVAQDPEKHLKNAIDRNVLDCQPHLIASQYKEYICLKKELDFARSKLNSNSKLLASKKAASKKLSEKNYNSPREAQPKNNIGESLSDKDSIVSSKSLDPDSDLSSLLSELKSLKEQIKVLSSQTSLLYTELVKNALKLPNLSHPNSPIGPEENAEIYYQSNKIFDPNFILRISDCSPVTGSAANCKSNSELCESLGIANFKAAAKVSGSRFLYWLGKGLILEQALIQYTLKRAVEFGFSPVATPELVKSSIVEKCGFRPRTDTFENGEPSQIYTIENANDPDSESNGDPLCLIATSEIPLTAMYSEETLTCYDPNLNSTKNSPEYPHSQKTDNGTADQLIGNKQDPNCDSQHDIPNVKWFGNGKKFHDKYKTHLRDTNTLFSKSPKKQQVPIALVGLSHCYRSEAGSRGKDTSGL
ncbi:Serine-tRNA ligase, partial [Smittium mucronatum]